MRIGLISDSHIPASTRRMPEQVFHAFEGVDLILHAGDIYTASALDDLERIAPVLAVGGPGVDQGIAPPRVEVTRLIAVEGVRFGLVHQLSIENVLAEVFPGTIGKHQPPEGSVRRSLHRIFGQAPDVCVFGDTHADLAEWHEGVLLINPGSPTLPYQFRRLGTVAVIDIVEGVPNPQILRLTDFPGPEPSYK